MPPTRISSSRRRSRARAAWDTPAVRAVCFGSALLSSVLVLALVPVLASAGDSDAPIGASDRWLPAEDWVMSHWLPFDERLLYAKLGLSRERVLDWMRDDRHHTLAQLGQRRGLPAPQLARELVVAWAPPDKRIELSARALRVLTQGHLAQHVLFHYFHNPGIGLNAARIFGVDPLEFQWRRLRGESPALIAAVSGRRPASVARSALRALRGDALAGVERGATPRRQARRWLAYERRGLRHWLDSSIYKPGRRGEPAPALLGLPRFSLVCRLFQGRYPDPPVRSSVLAGTLALGWPFPAFKHR
jgi:hypothetical protein